MTATATPAAAAALQAWIGRTERLTDRVTPTPVAALAATLDRDDGPTHEGAIIAPLRHWLYFLPIHRWSELGPDGHARRGGFLPPVSLPRRMWAGGRLTYHMPLTIGREAARERPIKRVEVKSG